MIELSTVEWTVLDRSDFDEIKSALGNGPVFCTVDRLAPGQALVIHDVRRVGHYGVEVEILEGWMRPDSIRVLRPESMSAAHWRRRG